MLFFLANVDEYLRLTAQADSQQLARLKSMFEKKNSQSAQTVQQLQKKLDSYKRRLNECQSTGVYHPRPKEVLRDMGHGLK